MKRKNKIIIVINEYKYLIKNILKEYTVFEFKPKEYEEIYHKFDNLKEEIYVINIYIKYIDKLKEINKNLKPDIIFIPKLEDNYPKTVEMKMFKYIKKGLKKLKNKILIINDNDKYLKNMFMNNLDIYRYGNNEYDDIEYIKEKENIIINYQEEKYTLKNKNEDIIGNIIIGLLFGLNIEEIIDNIEKK